MFVISSSIIVDCDFFSLIIGIIYLVGRMLQVKGASAG